MKINDNYDVGATLVTIDSECFNTAYSNVLK